MRRAFVLIGAGGALVLAGMAWLAAAQLGGRDESILAESSDAVVKVPMQAKVDLNQASRQELEHLPGITPALAERIAKHRPYRKLDDLVTRKVLGKKQFARIREFVVVIQTNP
jgi:DNA uptake protein ComE-like DNA-binding protein